jgi:hypothetical protein
MSRHGFNAFWVRCKIENSLVENQNSRLTGKKTKRLPYQAYIWEYD